MKQNIDFLIKTLNNLESLPIFCGKKWLFWLGSFLTVLAILSFLYLPYGNGDTVYYTMVGRGIFRDHMLPYSYAFDHKPWGVYLFYGAWDKICPFFHGDFFFLSLVLGSVTLYFCRFFGTFNIITALFIYIFVGNIFGILDGNTENVLTACSSIVLAVLYNGLSNKRFVNYFIPGFMIPLLININYLVAVSLFLPVLFLLFSPRFFKLQYIFIFSIGCIVGLLTSFSPYLIEGNNALQSYFRMQHDFLQNYGGNTVSRISSVLCTIAYTVMFLPVLLLWYRKYREEMRAGEPSSLLLPLWFISSLPATVLSGHPFNHYYILCFVPLVIMVSVLFYQNVKFPRYSFLFLCIVSIISQGFCTGRNIRWLWDMSFIDYALITREAAHQRVLNIRADQAFFYMGDFRTFDRYAFTDHVDIMFGAGAEKRYLNDLAQHPPLVMTPFNACMTGNAERSVCDVLKKNYTLIYSVNALTQRKGKLPYFSLDLYRLAKESK